MESQLLDLSRSSQLPPALATDFEHFQERKEANSTRQRIDNKSLPAGSPIHLDCDLCGADIEVLESYTNLPDLCPDCTALREALRQFQQTLPEQGDVKLLPDLGVTDGAAVSVPEVPPVVSESSVTLPAPHVSSALSKQDAVDKKIAAVCKEYDRIERLPGTEYCTVMEKSRSKPGIFYGILSLESGELVLPVEYKAVTFLTPTLCKVKQGGLLDKDATKEDGGKHGVFSLEQEELIVPVEYCAIQRLNDTMFAVFDGNSEKWGIFSSEKSTLILPIQYYRIRYCNNDTVCYVEEYGNGWKTGAFSLEKEEFVVPVKYKKVEFLTGTLYEVREEKNSADYYGIFCSEKGELISPMKSI